MGSKGWIKRVLPFFATFAIGIFIASFFVNVRPNWGRHGRWKMRAEIERLRSENEELRNENLRLRNDGRRPDMDVDLNIPDIEPVPLDLPPTVHTCPKSFLKEHRPPRNDK